MTRAALTPAAIARTAVLCLAPALAAQSVTRNAAFGRLVAGIALLVILTNTTTQQRPKIRMAAALPGALLVASGVGVPLLQRWAAPLTVAVIMVAAATATTTHQRLPPGAAWALLLVTLGGIYACVPETGQMGPLAAAAALLAVYEAATHSRIQEGVMAAAIAMAAWSVAYGGTYRGSALIGGFSSFGVLLLFPAAAALPYPRPIRPNAPRPTLRLFVIAVLHVAAALVVSRTAGLAHSTGMALAIAAIVLTLLLIGTTVAGARQFGSTDADSVSGATERKGRMDPNG